jgi:hypothetical protein
VPILTFVNKLDREAGDPFDLLDEIEQANQFPAPRSRKSGSHKTHRWREMDSNPRSRSQRGPSTGLEFVNRGDPSASTSVSRYWLRFGKS